MLRIVSLLSALALATVAFANDPAPGWMGYATGVHPTNSSARLTHAEAKWAVPPNPRVGGAFFSPWFGIETSDNENLFQPVNPWTGNGWLYYVEAYQWDPPSNRDSAMNSIQPGDILHGVVDYVAANNSYTASHTNLATGETIFMNIPVQEVHGKSKLYNIMYVVFEKSEFNCDQYPPSGQVTFYDIVLQYDHQTVQPKWTTGYVDDNCDNRAHVVNESSIQITWQTS